MASMVRRKAGPSERVMARRRRRRRLTPRGEVGSRVANCESAATEEREEISARSAAEMGEKHEGCDDGLRGGGGVDGREDWGDETSEAGGGVVDAFSTGSPLTVAGGNVPNRAAWAGVR